MGRESCSSALARTLPARRVRLTRKLNKVRDRERLLREAYLYEGRIDAEVFDEENATLSKQRGVVERAMLQASPEDVDVDTLIDEFEHLLVNLGSVWERAPVAPRRALQELIFPEGLPVQDKAVRTPPNG